MNFLKTHNTFIHSLFNDCWVEKTKQFKTQIRTRWCNQQKKCNGWLWTYHCWCKRKSSNWYSTKDIPETIINYTNELNHENKITESIKQFIQPAIINLVFKNDDILKKVYDNLSKNKLLYKSVGVDNDDSLQNKTEKVKAAILTTPEVVIHYYQNKTLKKYYTKHCYIRNMHHRISKTSKKHKMKKYIKIYIMQRLLFNFKGTKIDF